MTLVENVITAFSNYPILISFLVGLFGGEEIIITLSFLSANGLMPLWIIFVFTILGVYLSDIAMYYVGRLRIINSVKDIERFSVVFEKLDSLIIKLSNESLFRTLMFSKLMYGTRALILIYLGIKRADVRKFLIYDFIVVVAVISVVVPLGWFAGSSFRIIIESFKNIQLGILVIVIFVVLIFILKKWLEQRLIRWRNR